MKASCTEISLGARHGGDQNLERKGCISDELSTSGPGASFLAAHDPGRAARRKGRSTAGAPP